MTIQHHINDDLLVAYAAGSLSESWSLLVASHLALCPTCRKALEAAETMGAQLLETIAPVSVAPSSFDALLARLDGDPYEPALPPSHETIPTPSVLPSPLRDYVGGDLHALKWRRLGKGAFHIPIKTRDGEGKARLLKVPAGKPVPAHSHGGEELTLVLTGSFSTYQGTFHRGDVETADETVEHMPVAGPGEDCICLAVTDAPLRFKSLAARIVQPLIGI